MKKPLLKQVALGRAAAAAVAVWVTTATTLLLLASASVLSSSGASAAAADATSGSASVSASASALTFNGVHWPHWPHYGGPDRVVSFLDGDDWQFGLELSEHFDSMDPLLDPASLETPNTTRVPSCFDAAPMGEQGARGVGIYRKHFTHAVTKIARIQFEACSFYCRVFVDGKEVGDHRAGGYVAFHLDVPPPTSGQVPAHGLVQRELLVLADNRFNSTTAPLHTGGDFWAFGGIMRSVSVHEIPFSTGFKAESASSSDVEPPVVWRAEVLPNDVAERAPVSGDRTVNISVVLSDPLFEGPFNFTLRFDGAAKPTGPFVALARAGRVETMSFVPVPGTSSDAALWTLDRPNLHTVAVGDATGTRATVTERFGLRTWGIDEATRRLTLNGHIVKLHGFNHHTQWPDVRGDNISVTASMTDEQMDFDIAQMTSIGANYVRGAHYPQDARWLDRLDESGFAMWEETLGPGVSVENIRDPTFMRFQLQQLNEMIDHSINHASIMTWGWFNEGPSDREEACSGYAANAETARSRDSTRFGTWASDKAQRDKCLEHASLVSFNHYPAWYDSEGDLSAPARFWNAAAAFVGGLRKPFTISETGAGAIYEWADNSTDGKWTCKYQTEVIERDVDVALKNANISGITIWHYFDFKVDDNKCGPCDYVPGVFPPECGYTNVSCARPGGFNHKGVTDFWRRKKPSWDAVQSRYRGAPKN